MGQRADDLSSNLDYSTELMVCSLRFGYETGGIANMRRLFVICGALLLGALMASAQPGLTLQVQLHYTGSGTVDETHKIFVALWDSSAFTDDHTPPVAVQPASSKNGTVTFSDVQKVPAYVHAAYEPT